MPTQNNQNSAHPNDHFDADTEPTPDARSVELPTQEELQRELDRRDSELRILRRTISITNALASEPVVDLEAARVLVEHAMDGDDGASPDDIVRSMRREKPFLFRASSTARSHGAAAPQPSHQSNAPLDRAAEQLDSAATDARSTGRATDLMRYLRLRRSV